MLLLVRIILRLKRGDEGHIMNMYSAKDKGIGLDRRHNLSESYFFNMSGR